MPQPNNQPAQPQEAVVAEIVHEVEGEVSVVTNRCDSCSADTGSRWRPFCDSCDDERHADCYNCGDSFLRETMDEHNAELWCSSCLADEYDYSGWPGRDYFKGNSAQYQSDRPGKLVQSTRIFSAEIECYSPSAQSYLKAYSNIPEGIGATEDGSLGDNGREFQTPKLKGAKGEEVLRQLCKTLNDNDFNVDDSCGLHIHLDGRGLFPRTKSLDEPKALKQLWAFYYAYEPVIHSFLPSARRTNSYCYSIQRTTHLTSIVFAKTLRAIEKLWYTESRVAQIDRRKDHKYDDTRYNGVNLHSLLGSKHLEIRYHSGTLNSTKILQWVNLHLSVLDRSASKVLDATETLIISTKYCAMVKEGKSEAALDMLTASMFDRLNLNDAARAYFLKRQGQFTGRKGSIPANDESSLCAA